MESNRIFVIDASNTVLGRVASSAAKKAVLGYNVKVVNCKEAIISGRRQNVLKEYRLARGRGGSSLNGPNFPKESFRIMKRTIRGMLNYSHGKGKEAFKRVMDKYYGRDKDRWEKK